MPSFPRSVVGRIQVSDLRLAFGINVQAEKFPQTRYSYPTQPIALKCQIQESSLGQFVGKAKSKVHENETTLPNTL